MAWLCDYFTNGSRSSTEDVAGGGIKTCEAVLGSVLGAGLFFLSLFVCIALIAVVYTSYHPPRLRSRKYLLGRKRAEIFNCGSKFEVDKASGQNDTSPHAYTNGGLVTSYFDDIAQKFMNKDSTFESQEMPTVSSQVQNRYSKPDNQPLGKFLRDIVERDAMNKLWLDYDSPKQQLLGTGEEKKNDDDNCSLDGSQDDNEDIVIIDQNYWRQYPKDWQLKRKENLQFISANKYRQNSAIEDYLSSDPEMEATSSTKTTKPSKSTLATTTSNTKTLSKKSQSASSLQNKESRDKGSNRARSATRSSSKTPTFLESEVQKLDKSVETDETEQQRITYNFEATETIEIKQNISYKHSVTKYGPPIAHSHTFYSTEPKFSADHMAKETGRPIEGRARPMRRSGMMKRHVSSPSSDRLMNERYKLVIPHGMIALSPLTVKQNEHPRLSPLEQHLEPNFLDFDYLKRRTAVTSNVKDLEDSNQDSNNNFHHSEHIKELRGNGNHRENSSSTTATLQRGQKLVKKHRRKVLIDPYPFAIG